MSLGPLNFVNTWNHRNPSTPWESSCFATENMSWIFSLISTPSLSNKHLKLTTCHLHHSSRNYRWFHDFYVCSLGAPISANTWNHRNPSTPLKSSCFATEIMSWMFSLISTPSFSHTHVKFSTQISNFKQLYLFTEALSGKSELNSDSLKRST